MNKLKKQKEKKLLGDKFRFYIDCVILVCCIIIAINIHPSNVSNGSVDSSEGISGDTKMIYIFHDYEGNEFIMNDNIHGASSSRDYLFDDEIPDDLKGSGERKEGSVSIGDSLKNSNVDNSTGNEEMHNSEGIKDNQVSINDIMSDLGIANTEFNTEINIESGNNNSVDINIGDYDSSDDIYGDLIYAVTENTGSNKDSLIIEKINDNGNSKFSGESSNLDDNDTLNNKDSVNSKDKPSDEGDDLMIAKSFSFVDEGWVLPTLVPWNDLFFGNENSNLALSYSNNNAYNSDIGNSSYNNTDSENQKSGITIIGDYADCMTPWGYKIMHGESVLAYQQMKDSPNICNIERRFCWKGKLSGTYTQQGCSTNNNYSYEERGGSETKNTKQGGNSETNKQGGNFDSSQSKDNFKGSTRQNDDGTVTVKSDEIGGSFVFDRPNNTSSDFTGGGDNIRPEDSEVELYDRPIWDCTSPRGEKVKHGHFVQAFKHKNGFSDIPCEAQFRLCSVGELMGTFTEASCKTWDTSFVDWVYGSPTRETYADEKLELIKKQLNRDEKNYNRDRKRVGKLSIDDDFDELLYLLDENY